ncbi:hypothetical protein ID866_9141 [Astraeus odoratus]|nr:hypothetical protein ID866_9141 [Astraeus odoratus]
MTLWKDTVAFLSGCSPVERPLEGKPGYLELDIGVWRVIIAKESLFRLPGTRFFQDVMGVSPLFHRACKDLYSISPPMFLFTICANLWYAMERTLSLYFSSRLLFHVSRAAFILYYWLTLID